MAKKLGLISPTQLWGKPLKSAAPQKPAEEKVKGKMTYDDEVTEDEDIDVDAELAEADVEEDDLQAIEAESDSEVTDDGDAGDPDEEEDAEDDEPDYDGEDGDASDSAEATVEDEEEVVTAVADDSEEDGDEEIPETRGKGSMSEKMSLSDHVRAEIARRQKSGDSLRGKDIVEALAKRKLTVSPAQVSQLLKKAGLGGQPRGKKAATATAAPVEKSRAAGKGAKRNVEAAPASPKAGVKTAAKGRPTGNGFKVPLNQLQAAEEFVAACGGSFQAATRILTAAEQLSETFGG